MRRRLVIMLAILLVAGFATNAAVAWYVLWKVHTDFHSNTWPGGYFRELLRDDAGRGVVWDVGFSPGRGTLYLWSTYGGPLGADYLRSADPQDLVIAEVPRWAEPYLMVRDSAGTPMPHTHIRERQIYAGGFPMLSLYSVVDGDIYTDDFDIQGGIAIEHYSELFGDTDYFVVPYRPVLIGLIVNTVFWAGVWAIPIAVVLAGRRLWRYERGRCPRCGYDLRRRFSDGCPECGWRRAATA